jgi:hypothetical protein
MDLFSTKVLRFSDSNLEMTNNDFITYIAYGIHILLSMNFINDMILQNQALIAFLFLIQILQRHQKRLSVMEIKSIKTVLSLGPLTSAPKRYWQQVQPFIFEGLVN